MARYRKIDVRIHGDERFRRLSAPQPCGQSCFTYLLTAPESSMLPGLFRAGMAALAEALGWSPEAFLKAFQEVSAEGLAKADPEARVVFLPNVIKYDPPQSPNVVTGWASYWDEIPECALKLEAWERYHAYFQEDAEAKKETTANPEAFLKAFRKACPKPFPKTLANQEQEQEQDKHSSSTDIEGAPVKTRKREKPSDPEGFAEWWAEYPKKVGRIAAVEAWKRMASIRPPLAKLLESLRRQKLSAGWQEEGGKYILDPERWLKYGRWDDVVPAAGSPTAVPVPKPLTLQQIQTAANGRVLEAELHNQITRELKKRANEQIGDAEDSAAIQRVLLDLGLPPVCEVRA